MGLRDEKNDAGIPGGSNPGTTRKGAADFSDVSGGSSSTASNAPIADIERTYVVEKGDSLSRIAQREYGDANKWHEIYKANSDVIKNPDLIYPGQKLRLP